MGSCERDCPSITTSRSCHRVHCGDSQSQPRQCDCFQTCCARSLGDGYKSRDNERTGTVVRSHVEEQERREGSSGVSREERAKMAVAVSMKPIFAFASINM